MIIVVVIQQYSFGNFITIKQRLKSIYITQVQEFNGAVGEITILYYRMQLVDFTMPYLVSEIGMLVPNKYVEIVALTPVAKIDLTVATILALVILVAVLLWIWKLCNNNGASSQFSGNNNMKGKLQWSV